MSDHRWKVGDPVIVAPDGNGHGGGSFVVAKVGPKLLTIGSEYGRSRQFRLDDDGRENTDGRGGYCYAMTPAEHAERTRRATSERALDALTSGSRQWCWKSDLTVEQMDAIVAIIKGGAK